MKNCMSWCELSVIYYLIGADKSLYRVEMMTSGCGQLTLLLYKWYIKVKQGSLCDQRQVIRRHCRLLTIKHLVYSCL